MDLGPGSNDYTSSIVDHRKRRRRRRRRRLDRPPLSAKLVLDDHETDDVGLLSLHLFNQLFLPFGGDNKLLGEDQDAIRYVAITPWAPLSSHVIEDLPWTILPVRTQDVQGDGKGSQSILRLSASSPLLPNFTKSLPNRNQILNIKSSWEILILDVQPLLLDSVFVKVDGDALEKHEDVQMRFGGGFHGDANGYAGKGKGKAKAVRGNEKGQRTQPSKDDREKLLRSAVRKSLEPSRIVRKGDLLSLPLPAHPITHVPFPPVKITMCESVNQGLLHGGTRIIIDIVFSHETDKKRPLFSTRGKSMQKIAADDTDDGSTESFFSAAENGHVKDGYRGYDVPSVQAPGPNSDQSSSEDSSTSDESSDNMISLSSANLPPHGTGTLSSLASATPRTAVSRRSGFNSPGSVYSNFTTTTARQGQKITAKLFRPKPLLKPIPDEILHPRPNNNEDEEARAFIDMKHLARLGCFSGDWVKIFPDLSAADGKEEFWGIGTFERRDTSSDDFRAVKIYGIADLAPKRSLGNFKKPIAERRSSATLPIRRPSPELYVPPILLTNLGYPTQVRIAPLLSKTQDLNKPTKSKIDNSMTPPTAKEITLLRLATPLSTERAMQNGVLMGLKGYFERKRRILRRHDLIAVSLDVGISKILSESSPDASNDNEELLSNPFQNISLRKRDAGVAWFKVGQIIGPSLDEDASTDLEVWGVASIEPIVTRMIQVGTEQSKVPSSLDNPWVYYLGIKRSPRFSIFMNTTLQCIDSIAPPNIIPLRRRIRELLTVATSPRAHHLDMKPIVILIYSTQRSIGKTYTVLQACADLGLHVFPIDAYDILSEGGAGGDVKTEASLKARIDRAMSCGSEFTVPLIRHMEALTADRMASALKDVVQGVRAMIMTTTDIDKIPENIRSLFTHELEISAPDEREREGILREIILARGVLLAYDVDLAAIAVKTAALVAGDLVDVVERALVARQERMEKLSSRSTEATEDSRAILPRDLLVSGGPEARCVTKADFDLAVEAARKNFADAIGAPKIPNVGWDDVGGLTNVKDAVMETIQLPLERPELFAKGMKKRSGILFYGPPGTGKTLLAKAIATEFSLNFFSVKGPELLNMYIGESEANVRRVFQRARDARPCVVFFDELDSVAPKRGNQGDSGGVMDRIVSQLLAELDGMSGGDEGGGGVFVIGATNRPDLLDQALLRPGRFDKMLYLGVADTHDKQLTILEALTRKFTLHPDMSLRRVAESLPFTYTGADLYALCSDAMLKAITRQASAVDAKIKAMSGPPITTAYFFDHYATKEDIAVMVMEDDFFAAQRELIGSVR